MKVAVVSESPADEAAIARLVSAVIGVPVEPVAVTVRHDSWPRIYHVLPRFLGEVYFRTDAAGLVLVVDADDSPLHEQLHDPQDAANQYCRVCMLRQLCARTMATLAERPVAFPLQVAIGLAVPTIEAWLLCGRDHQVSEAAWINARRQQTLPYSRNELKRRLYGHDRPSLDLETEAMIREADRHTAEGLRSLRQLFSGGFGALEADLLAWNLPNP